MLWGARDGLYDGMVKGMRGTDAAPGSRKEMFKQGWDAMLAGARTGLLGN
jgi:hypothetical protein